METILKLMIDLMSEGKSDEEIVAKIKGHEDLKGKTAKDVIAVLDEAKREYEIQKEFKSRKEKTREEEIKAQATSQVSALVKEELKKHELSGSFFGDSKKLKQYNPMTGKYVEFGERESESINQQGKLLKALMRGKEGLSEASAISREIEQENKNIEKHQHTKAANLAGTGNVGGYAVATVVDNQIHELLYAQSVVMQNFNTDVIMVNDKIYPVMANVSVVDIADEDTAATISTPAFTNPTTSMKRAGAYSAISNKLIGASDADIVSAFIRSYGAAFARFIDARIFIGNVTGASNLIDGLVWNTNANLPTAVALSALGVDDVADLLKRISDEASNVKLFGNRGVKFQLGLDETTGGMSYFPNFVNGGGLNPFGTPFIENTKITNVLQVGGDNSTGGTSTVLVAADCDNIIVGVGAKTRIDISDQFLFTKDQIVIRGIKDYGYSVLQASGKALQVLELTGA